MKKKTKEEVVNVLEVFLKKLQEQKISNAENGYTVITHDIDCVKHVIELIEQHEVEGKVDLDKYDRISGSEWNETLEKKDGDK